MDDDMRPAIDWSKVGSLVLDEPAICPECGGLAQQLLPSEPGAVIWRCLTCGVRWESWFDQPSGE